jgi:hypothetical protein
MFLNKIFTRRKFKKSVAVYISQLKNQIIVCPSYINDAGIVYEQETCTLLDFPIGHSVLGEEVVRNFNLFGLKDKNLRDQKLTDWPAFKHSKIKSVKLFEEAFFKINVTGNNESNIILSVEADLASDGDFQLASSISAYANKEAIGAIIIKVYQKALSS